jgi:hypothetical protein
MTAKIKKEPKDIFIDNMRSIIYRYVKMMKSKRGAFNDKAVIKEIRSIAKLAGIELTADDLNHIDFELDVEAAKTKAVK